MTPSSPYPLSFPEEHNCETACGERATLSACGHFRISESNMAHWRPAKSTPWQDIDVLPFPSWAAAVAACERVAERERLPRKRGQVMKRLERAKFKRRRRTRV